MNTLESIQAPVQADLHEFRRQFTDTLQSDNPLLHAALDHILNRCGKMVRPTMVMLAARSVGEVNQRSNCFIRPAWCTMMWWTRAMRGVGRVLSMQ